MTWELAGVGPASAASLAEQVPLLQGLRRSSSSSFRGSPVTDFLLHSSPMRSGGSQAAGEANMGEQHRLEGSTGAPRVGVNTVHSAQDRYGGQDVWTDSTETMANMPASRAAEGRASGDAGVASPAAVACVASPAAVVIERRP